MDFKHFWFQNYGQNATNVLGKSPLIPYDIPEIFGFFGHNFGPRNAKKLIKGSKYSY